MLALYIAFAIGLDRPYWAMTTIYITAHPLTGMTRSKAVYRLIGTLVGAIAVIVLVPDHANAPELLCLALALWIRLCLYLGLLDRSPRGYSASPHRISIRHQPIPMMNCHYLVSVTQMTQPASSLGTRTVEARIMSP